MTTAASEKLMTDVKVVLTDAENLLNRAAEASGEQAADLRARGMQMLRQARNSAQELQETAVARGRAAGRAADAYVHEHPWRTARRVAAQSQVILDPLDGPGRGRPGRPIGNA